MLIRNYERDKVKPKTPTPVYHVHVIYQDKVTKTPMKTVYALDIPGLDRSKHPDHNLIRTHLNKHPDHKNLILSGKMKPMQMFGSFNGSSEHADEYFKGISDVFKARAKQAKMRNESLIESIKSVMEGDVIPFPKSSVIKTAREILKPANDDSSAKRADDLYTALAGTVSGKDEYNQKKIDPSYADVIIWHKKHSLIAQGNKIQRSKAYMHYVDWVDINKVTTPVPPGTFHDALKSIGIQHSFDGNDIVYHGVNYKDATDDLKESWGKHIQRYIAKKAVNYAADKYSEWKEKRKRNNSKQDFNISWDPSVKRFWGYHHDPIDGSKIHIRMTEPKFKEHLIGLGIHRLGEETDEPGLADPRTGTITHQSWSNHIGGYIKQLKNEGEQSSTEFNSFVPGTNKRVADEIQDHLRQASSHKYMRERKTKAADIMHHPDTGEPVVAKVYHKEREDFHKQEARKLGWRE